MSEATGAHLSTSDLVRKRMDEIGIDRAEVSRRSGRSNVSKFRRKLDALLDGDLDPDPSTILDLATALGLEGSTIRDTLAADKERQRLRLDAEWRRTFVPHAVMWTERTVPSQITMSGMAGFSTILKLDVARHPRTFASQALEALRRSRWYGPELGNVAWMGKALGVVVNYDPDKSEFFDMDGRSVEKRNAAVAAGRSTVALG